MISNLNPSYNPTDAAAPEEYLKVNREEHLLSNSSVYGINEGNNRSKVRTASLLEVELTENETKAALGRNWTNFLQDYVDYENSSTETCNFALIMKSEDPQDKPTKDEAKHKPCIEISKHDLAVKKLLKSLVDFGNRHFCHRFSYKLLTEPKERLPSYAYAEDQVTEEASE
jgi:hypothetical protein